MYDRGGAAMPVDTTEPITLDELRALIDGEAARLLSITGDQFRNLYHKAVISSDYDADVRHLTMLVDLEDEARAQQAAA